MEYICQLFGKSRQAWYDSRKRTQERQCEGIIVLKKVREIRKNHPRMGTENLMILLQETFSQHHIKMGRDKLHLLLSQHDLLIRQRSFKPRTTDSNHPYRKYRNLIGGMQVQEPNKIWASDITYISTQKGFVYLSLVTDCYSHKIVGWCLHPTLESAGAVNALEMALETNPVRTGLIHHSDRGIQYCCHNYVEILERNKIEISMTENGDPHENALAERVNGILKMEYRLNTEFEDYYPAQEAVKKAVEMYNTQRPHSSCDKLTPEAAHKGKGELRKHWKNTRRAKVEDNS